MAAANINRVVLTGNLTADPELRQTPGGLSICRLRLAVNGRRKNASGEWVDKAGFFNLTVFGAHGEACAKYLAKGKPVAVDGRLEFNEWTTDSGDKRSSVGIVADSVQFLGGRDDRDLGSGNGNGGQGDDYAAVAQPAAGGGYGAGRDEEIPFAPSAI